jgi:serine/threonine protein phosphatase PrpC
MATSLSSELGSVYATAIQGARSQQQDSIRVRWLADEDAWLIALADGMGGHAAGDLASKIAVDSFVGTFAARRDERDDLGEAFRLALEDANGRIAAVQSARPETSGMGTTLVAVHLSREGLRWISVGDSLLWLYRDGSLTQLNEDHSLRSVSPEQRGDAAPNVLISALSGGPIQKIDLRTEPVAINGRDLVIVASDGMLTLSTEQMSTILVANASAEAEAITEALIDSVNREQKPHQDNCTIALYAGNAEPPRRRSLWLPILAVLFALLLAGALGAAAFPLWKQFW